MYGITSGAGRNRTPITPGKNRASSRLSYSPRLKAALSHSWGSYFRRCAEGMGPERKAGEEGVEPSVPGLEPGVLPLHYSPVRFTGFRPVWHGR